jgi:nitrogen regulatory protein PII
LVAVLTVVRSAIFGFAIKAIMVWRNHATMIKVELQIAVNDDDVKPTVDAIIKGARTGNIGDGKIFVLDLPDCIRIRTGETGKAAIG